MEGALSHSVWNPASIHACERNAILIVQNEQEAEMDLSIKIEIWDGGSEQLGRLAMAVRLLWYCGSPEMEAEMMLPAETGENATSQVVMLASRLLGGHIVGQSWLQKCREKRQLLRPFMMLQPALSQTVEVLIHSSLAGKEGEAASPAAVVLARCHQAWQTSRGGDLNFILRTKSKEMSPGGRILTLNLH